MSEPRERTAARPASAGARWPAWMGAAALGAAALALLPRLAASPLWPECALRRATGVACPTCGLTRAFGLLARGAWSGSLALHPWALLLMVQAAAAAVLWVAWRAGWLRARPDRWIPHAVAVNLAGLALLWLARLATGTLPG